MRQLCEHLRCNNENEAEQVDTRNFIGYELASLLIIATNEKHCQQLERGKRVFVFTFRYVAVNLQV